MNNESIPMLLWCPQCNQRHIDVGVFETKSHHTHACQYCGMSWRPAIVATKGVQFLPGFKDSAQINPLYRKPQCTFKDCSARPTHKRVITIGLTPEIVEYICEYHEAIFQYYSQSESHFERMGH